MKREELARILTSLQDGGSELDMIVIMGETYVMYPLLKGGFKTVKVPTE